MKTNKGISTLYNSVYFLKVPQELDSLYAQMESDLGK